MARKETKMARKSAWSKGVETYAQELQEFLAENNLPATKENLLNGASNWREYSYGGCSLVYDYEIAERLCTPSEIKRTDNGRLQPNRNETWLDCQARALFQASRIVLAGAQS
jgi:hypothetical protein